VTSSRRAAPTPGQKKSPAPGGASPREETAHQRAVTNMDRRARENCDQGHSVRGLFSLMNSSIWSESWVSGVLIE
jgi:hypothetical protein